MKQILIFLVIAMIAKDALPIGDVYIMRGITQGLALGAGVLALFLGLRAKTLKKNWLVFSYLLFIALSIFISPFQQYTALQVLSLTGPLLLFIGSLQETNYRIAKTNQFIISLIIVLYATICFVSLIMWIHDPSSVQEVLWGNEIRFTGLFNKSGMMGTAAGLLLGLAILKKLPLMLKAAIAIPAAICLYLTLSRTFVVASVIGLVITYIVYFPYYRARAAVLTLLATVSLSVFFITHQIDAGEEKSISKIIRADSFENLSGRLGMWQSVLAARVQSGLIGEGFSMGGILLLEHDHRHLFGLSENSDPRMIGRTTLHSGYVQALADLGWIGLAIYVVNIMFCSITIYSKDRGRNFPIEFYMSIFLTIANGAESVIYTGSNFPTLLFWYLCIFSNNFSQTYPQNKIHQSPPVGPVAIMTQSC